MSYILDALRRADAERSRGKVPDLHARPHAEPDDDPPERGAATRLPRIAAGAAVAAAAVGLAWWWLAGRAGEAVAPAPPAVPVAAAPALPAPTTPAPMAPAPATPPPAPAGAAPAPAPAPSVPPTITEAAAAPRPAPRRPERPPAEAAPAARTVTALADLAPDVRRALPPLRFGGAIGSPDPRSRVLIVDGALLHEGDQAAPGVTLREIRLRSAVVEFRGRLVELPY